MTDSTIHSFAISGSGATGVALGGSDSANMITSTIAADVANGSHVGGSTLTLNCARPGEHLLDGRQRRRGGRGGARRGDVR